MKESEKNKEGFRKNADQKEPINPEEIAEHDPTAVKRDKDQVGSGDPV